MQGPKRDISVGGQLAQIWGVPAETRRALLRSSEESSVTVAPCALGSAQGAQSSPLGALHPGVGSSCWHWLPSGRWVGWGGHERRDSGREDRRL